MEALLSGKKGNTQLSRTIRTDIELLENGIQFPAADRYIDLIYPDFTTAADYLPHDALVIEIDHGRISERAKSFAWQQGEDIKALLEAGKLHPGHARFSADLDSMNEELSLYPIVFLDTFIGARYPLSPLRITGFTAKQLPSYGGSIDTAVQDIRHYSGRDFSVVVLCRNELRAKNLVEILAQRDISASLDPGLRILPEKGRVSIALGTVAAGFEYPSARIAVITEGQIVAERKAAESTQKLPRGSVPMRTSPREIMSYMNTTVWTFSGIVTMTVDGVDRTISNSPLRTDTLYACTQLDLVSNISGRAKTPV